MISPSSHDFSVIRPALQSYVDRQILAGVSSAILHGQELLYLDCLGDADIENQIALRPDHLFRVFSNTKLITSMAVLLLMDQGKLRLEDAVDIYLPQLAKRQVLRPGTTDIHDTEPAKSAITIRHLLTHTSGLSYGWLDHGTTIYKAYVEHNVFNAFTPLSHLLDLLEDLPLAFQPGSSWEYSIASDVLARLVEVISGESFDLFIRRHIFVPLAMHDTGFVVPESERERLTAYYSGSDPTNRLKRGLKRRDDAPYPGAYLTPVPRLSGGGGLVSSLPDMLALLRCLMPGGRQLLKPTTIAMMMQNQLPDGMGISFPSVGYLPNKGFGFGGAVILQPGLADPAGSAGEFEWGGIAGTHWWISPRHNIAGVLMAQRQMSFWHPFSFEFKKLAYQCMGIT
ncbi:serine hydrolase domain-containing protein [Undibacterium sp. Ren11W]|uniref:serine hydrolase domain-containing protein n=1 Tax=Undibacterium sp. Ren11W TaxID=3413045 RepID=UPI003BF42BD5